METRMWVVFGLVLATVGLLGLTRAKCQSCGGQCLSSQGCQVHCACMKDGFNPIGECFDYSSQVSR